MLIGDNPKRLVVFTLPKYYPVCCSVHTDSVEKLGTVYMAINNGAGEI